MNLFVKIIVSLLIAVVLIGCNETLTYTYLMEHPFVLKEKMDACQSIRDGNNVQADSCELVMRAANDLMLIINEQQQDPEKFGQKIMQAETAYLKAKEEWQRAQQSLNDLKAKNAAHAEIQAAESKLELAEKAYLKAKEDMKILLAVAGINSPE